METPMQRVERKLDDLLDRVIRIETRLFVFMSLEGHDPTKSLKELDDERYERPARHHTGDQQY